MSAASASAENEGPWLVRRARRPVPLHLLPLTLAAALVYGVIAALAPFTGQSLLGVMLQSVLFFLALSFTVLSPRTDRVDIFRVACLVFIVAFCIGDLFNDRRVVWYYIESYPALLSRTAALALLCFVSVTIGYYFPLFPRTPESIPARHDRVSPNRVASLGLVFFFIGVVFFFLFFAAAGGAAVIIKGEGEVARAHFGRGIGILFWPLMWMTSGGTLYFAARATQRTHMKWVAAWPLAVEFLLLTLLQGRHRALGPLVMGLVISHYLIKPLKIRRLLVFGVFMMIFAMTIAYVRKPSLRATFYQNPAAAVVEIRSDIGDHFRSMMTGDFGLVAKVMVIVDKVPAVRGYTWGETLLIPFNPIFRILGFHHLQQQAIGAWGYMLARPELNLDPRTTPGFLPSLVGEFRWNFPWPACIPFWILFGVFLRLIYQRLIVDRADFAAVAIYSVLGLYVVEMIFQSATQNVFEMVDVVVPMFLIRWLSLKQTAPAPFQSRLSPQEAWTSQ